MDRLEIMSEISALASKLQEKDLKDVISALQHKITREENKFEDIEEVENLAAELSVGARECFTYLATTGSLNEEQFLAFENLANDCEEFYRVFSFYARKTPFNRP